MTNLTCFCLLPIWINVIIYTFQPIYAALLISNKWQATLGMKLLGIRIEDLTGKKISLIRAIARILVMALPYYLPSFLLNTGFNKVIVFCLSILYLVSFIYIAFDKYKRGFHDYICNTHVVYKNGTKLVYELAPLYRRLGACIIDILILAFIFIFLVLLNFYINISSNVFMIIFYCIATIYSVILPTKTGQGTLGTQALRLKITDIEGNKISFSRSLARFISFMLIGLASIKLITHEKFLALLPEAMIFRVTIPLTLLAAITHLLVMIYRKDNRLLYDIVAQTYVVHLKNQ